MSDDEQLSMPPGVTGAPPRNALSVDSLYGPHNDYRERPDGYANRYETAGLRSPESFDLDVDWMTQFHPAVLLEVACLAQFCYPNEASVDIGLVPCNNEDDAYMLAVGRPESDDDYVVVGAPRVGPKERDAE